MKIGQFCSMFNTKPGTVRFYIEKGLLIPDSLNGHYVFSEKDVTDMRTLLKLKEFRFSLPEIYNIMTLTRYSNLVFQRELEDYIAILSSHLGKMEQEKQAIDNVIQGLQQEIATALSKSSDRPFQPSGMPIQFLPYLQCPFCHQPLILKDCLIEQDQIYNAELSCSQGCGYSSNIQQGILHSVDTSASALSKDEEMIFYRAMSPDKGKDTWMMNSDIVTLMHKCYSWMQKKVLEQLRPGSLLLEDYINSMSFIHSSLDHLPEHSLYILADPNQVVVEMYKHIIDNMPQKRNILYIVGHSASLPLRQRCVDVYVDLAANKYAMKHHGFALDDVAPYLREDSCSVGGFWNFRHSSPSWNELLRRYPECWSRNFELSSFITYIQQHWLTVTETNDLGAITIPDSTNESSFFSAGEKVSLFAFFAKNMRIHS